MHYGLSLVFLVACRSKPTPVPAPALAASVSVGHDAGPPDVATAALAEAPPPACPPYAERMAAGRKATVEKRYDDALAAFDDAQYSVPFDGNAWAERGYAKLLAGRPVEALADLRFAAIVADAATLPSVHFNLSLAYERVADVTLSAGEAEALGPVHDRAALLERGRAHLAAAAKLGNAVATAKLGARSHCPIARFTTSLDPVQLASTWRGVAKIVDPDSAATTEGAAQRIVCAPLDIGTRERDPKHDACGAPTVGKEIEVQTAYSNYHTFRTHLLPLDGGRFYVDSDYTSGGGCRGGTDDYRATLHDGVIEVTITEEDVHQVGDGRHDGATFWDDINAEQLKTCPDLTKAKDSGDLHCAVGEVTSQRFYDAKTGKALLWLEPVLPSKDDSDCADARTIPRSGL